MNPSSDESIQPKQDDNDYNHMRRPGPPKDVLVIVGNQEFQENSHLLRAFSEYFEAALGNGMKETQTKRFEFPDRDPKDWELLTKLLDPFDTQAVINQDNVDSMLPWLVELVVPKGIEKCDEVLEQLIGEGFSESKLKLLNDMAVRKSLGKILKVLPQSLEYNLPKSKSVCLSSIVHLLNNHRRRSLLRKGDIEAICHFVENYEDCRTTLWPSLEYFLPKPVPDRAHQDVLLTTQVLPEMVHDKISINYKKPKSPESTKAENRNGRIGRRLWNESHPIMLDHDEDAFNDVLHDFDDYYPERGFDDGY